jgi:ABC-type bacteriocin/lantibiotic exporter with double-glycine peptidase domain
MRLRSPKIKFLAIDEPRSALDPRAEFELFDRLRAAANTGKTAIFITHRFGHLTKFADLIMLDLLFPCGLLRYLIVIQLHEERGNYRIRHS